MSLLSEPPLDWTADASALDDATLIALYRRGETEAAETLYRRHVLPARRFAARLAGSAAADDLVSEAFANVLTALRGGHGPDARFLPYLLTTVRHGAYRAAVLARRAVPVDDLESMSDTTPMAPDELDALLESRELVDAFRSLPDRWQEVLWHTALDGASAEQTADRMQLNPSSAAALAYRARKGLRQAYLRRTTAV